MPIEKYLREHGGILKKLKRVGEIRKNKYYSLGIGTHGFRAFKARDEGVGSRFIQEDTPYYERHLDARDAKTIIDQQNGRAIIDIDNFLIKTLGLYEIPEKSELVEKLKEQE